MFQSNQLISSLNVKANWIIELLFWPIEVGESKARLIERRRLSQWEIAIILLVVAENLLRSVVEVCHGKRVEVAVLVIAVWREFGAAGQLHLVDSRVGRLTSTYFSPLGPAFLLSAVPGRGNLEEMGKEAPGSYLLDPFAWFILFDSNRRHLPELLHQGMVRPLLAAFLLLVIICKDHTWFEELNHRRHHYYQHCDHQEPHHHNLIVFMSLSHTTTSFLQTTHLNFIVIMIEWINITTQILKTNSWNQVLNVHWLVCWIG